MSCKERPSAFEPLNGGGFRGILIVGMGADHDQSIHSSEAEA
jgi:hypothetical protein